MGLETVHRPSRTKIGDIEIDVVLTESSTDSAETTDHPVEQGFDVSDHARLKPVTLQITGIISNTPVGAVQSQRVVSLGGGVTFTSVSTERVGGAIGFAERAAADLRKLLEARQLVTVTTSKRVYTDMMLTDLITPRDGKTGDALTFQATFKRVRIVQNKTTRRVIAKRESKAQNKQKTGKQLPTENTTKKSIAYSLVEKLGLLDKLGVK